MIPLKEAPTTFKRSPQLHPVPRLEQRHDRLVQLAVVDNSDEPCQGLLGVPWAGLKAIRSAGVIYATRQERFTCCKSDDNSGDR